MGGPKRISEGKCALYGRDAPVEYATMQLWRNRLHNEHTGMAGTDVTGTNTGVSLMWNPAGTGAGAYALASRKRPSALKQIQDFGAGNLTPRSMAQAAAEACSMPRLPPSVASGPSASAMHDPQVGGFLDTETSRLQAAAHARNLGQTFLLAGNLRQAKLYLARAEQLLQVEERHFKGEKARKALDEFANQQKDPYR